MRNFQQFKVFQLDEIGISLPLIKNREISAEKAFIIKAAGSSTPDGVEEDMPDEESEDDVPSSFPHPPKKIKVITSNKKTEIKRFITALP